MLVAPTREPANTLAELVAQHKGKAQPFTIASSSNGTTPHLTAELLKTATGPPSTHVPYKGSGPAITDVTGGKVELLFSGVATISQLFKVRRIATPRCG